MPAPSQSEVEYHKTESINTAIVLGVVGLVNLVAFGLPELMPTLQTNALWDLVELVAAGADFGAIVVGLSAFLGRENIT